MKIRSSIFLILTLFFISCSNDDIKPVNEVWSKAQEYYENKDYNNSLVLLHQIVENQSYDDNFKAKSLFLISEIYLNEYKEYNISISFLNKILDNYPTHELAKRSLFTIAYINANYIEAFTEAVNLYNQFIEKYPSDELVSSVKYELDELDKYNETINNLINR